MEKDNIRKDLINVFEEVLGNDTFIKHNDIERIQLIDDLGISSITFIALVVKIEERFNIEIPVELLAFKYFQNISQLEDTIIKLL